MGISGPLGPVSQEKQTEMRGVRGQTSRWVSPRKGTGHGWHVTSIPLMVLLEKALASPWAASRPEPCFLNLYRGIVWPMEGAGTVSFHEQRLCVLLLKLLDQRGARGAGAQKILPPPLFPPQLSQLHSAPGTRAEEGGRN